jgi:hypothetical protein
MSRAATPERPSNAGMIAAVLGAVKASSLRSSDDVLYWRNDVV